MHDTRSKSKAATDAICGSSLSPAGADLRSDLNGANDHDGLHGAAHEYYPRRISIPVPPAASYIYGISNIEVPVRLILTALAADCPRGAATIAAMRDDFFGGDHEDDHEWATSGGCEPDIGWEKRAELAVLRRLGFAQRDAARAALLSEAASRSNHHRPFPVAFEAAPISDEVENEIKAIEVEFEIVETLQRALALDWQAFVLERHHYTNEQADRRRAQLLEKAQDLKMRDEGASARLRELSAGLLEC